jgi:hypothetical protein
VNGTKGILYLFVKYVGSKVTKILITHSGP